MEEIYKKAKEFKITIYPFEKNRLDNTNPNYIMPLCKLKKLDKIEFQEYLDALYCVHNENAGGYNGWATAYETFEKLGMVKQEEKQGHRIFVSYKWNK